MTQEDYQDVVPVCRDGTRKAKAFLEFNLENIGKKTLVTKNIKKAKELNELFGSELTGQICLQKFRILGPERKP